MSRFSPEQLVESEQELLLSMQLQHSAELMAAGITSKAHTEVPDIPMGPLTKTCITLRQNRTSEGSPVEQTCIRFIVTEVSGAGHDFEWAKDVPVVESYGGTTMPYGRFDGSDLAAVTAMRQGLEKARDMGVLPNLSHDLAHIHNPFANFAVIPSRPKSGT